MSRKVFKMGHMKHLCSVLLLLKKIFFFTNSFFQSDKLRFQVSKSFCKDYLVPTLFNGLSAFMASTYQHLFNNFSSIPGPGSPRSLDTLPQSQFFFFFFGHVACPAGSLFQTRDPICMPLKWKDGVLTPGRPGKSPNCFLK